MNTTTCFSCKATITEMEGPVHPYILSSPGCWNVYGDVLAKEYSPEYFDEYSHRITVDTYAVTHPGDKDNRKAVRSVNIHLISLYCISKKDSMQKSF